MDSCIRRDLAAYKQPRIVDIAVANIGSEVSPSMENNELHNYGSLDAKYFGHWHT